VAWDRAGASVTGFTPAEFAALRVQLEAHEGRRARPYRDTKGHLTVGIGRNIDARPFSAAVIDLMFVEDVAIVVDELRRAWPPFNRLDAVRRRALVDMGFMGTPRLLRFTRMFHALAVALEAPPAAAAMHYEEAARQALDSKWAREDVQPARSARVARMLRTGRDDA
jgi:lysozyme